LEWFDLNFKKYITNMKSIYDNEKYIPIYHAKYEPPDIDYCSTINTNFPEVI